MLKRLFAALVVGLLCVMWSAVALAFQPFVVKDIRVEGLQRIEAGTVFSYLPVKVGETMTEEKASEALRALYATGFFKEVNLDEQGNVLVVIVQERPAIAHVYFSGNKEFSTKRLQHVMRDIGLAPARIFERATLAKADLELKRQYMARGYYAARVQTTVTPLPRNRVGLNFTIHEGSIAKIAQINIVGVHAFSEGRLRDLFTLRPPGWLTWYTKDDQYSRHKLAGDLETLRSFYLDRGYLDFRIDSTQVSITSDRLHIYITVNVTEGHKYTVSKVTLGGKMPLPKKRFEKLVNIKAGQVFSREKLTKTTKAITDLLGNYGYAFANANAIPKLNRTKHTVAFSILIDPGRRVYVRRINISGNSKTRDEVIRQEMVQLEGAYYDASKILLSKRRINRTDFFRNVTVRTVPVPGRNDQVDVDYHVAERPTGSVLAGIGYSNVDKIILEASITQSNIFGSGKYVSAQVSTGSVNKIYSLTYNNPYYTVNGVSRGFDVYRRKVDASTLVIEPYTTDAYGGGVNYGYPISEHDTLLFGLNAEHVKLGVFSNSPPEYIDFVNRFGTTYTYGDVTGGWTRDTRNSAFMPTSGALTKAGLELAGGNLDYYKLSFGSRWYHPLTSTYTLATRLDLGYVHGLSSKPVPFFKNFYAGGPGSVRGYTAYSLGPKDSLGNSLGGTREITGSVGVLFPVPGASKDQSLRLTAFVDGGQVFGQGQKLTLSALRFSAGVGLDWSSPMGPLRLSYAVPLNAKPEDNLQRLQFTFGYGF